MLQAGFFFTGDRMAPEKLRSVAEKLGRSAANQGFCAACVGNQRLRLRMVGDDREGFKNSGDGQRDVNKISAANRACQIAGEFLNCASCQGVRRSLRSIESDRQDAREMLSKRECERAAN